MGARLVRPRTAHFGALARGLAAAALLGGCGRLHFDPLADDAGIDAALDAGLFDAGRVDAGPTDAGVVDSGTDAPSDAGLRLPPFGPPRRIDAVMSSAEDDDPTLTADLLELYYATDRPGSQGADIWVARRERVEDDWGPPERVPELNSPANDNTPGISRDGLTLYLASNRDAPGGPLDLYVSTRERRTDRWSTPVPLVELNTAAEENAPEPGADGLTLVFNRDVRGAPDLFLATRAAPGLPFDTVRAVDEVNTDAGELSGALSDDGLALYFHSNRPGGAGESDLYVARRADRSAPFDPPEPIAELNTAAREADPWISPDERLLVFSSQRDGASEIYEATR